MKKKVFCGNCKFFYSSFSKIYGGDTCEHPQNLKIISTFVGKEVVYVNSPESINQNNSCEWFKQVPWWRFWR